MKKTRTARSSGVVGEGGRGKPKSPADQGAGGKKQKQPGPPPTRQATVRLVEEAEASERVRAVFDDIKATKGIDFVPNFWRTLASHPPLLEDTWRRLKAVMAPGRLDALTKEMIALAVSATNGCAYCVNSHTAAVKKLGLGDNGLGELLAVVSLFNSTNTLADAYQVTPDVLPPQ